MTLVRGGRPLKRWRYVAIFCEELMACAALVQVGPARQSFWALLTRDDGRLRERTSRLPRGGRVVLAREALPDGAQGHQNDSLARARGSRFGAPPSTPPGRMLVNDRGVLLDLTLAEETGIEARCRDGRGEVWTRKQAGVAARGTLTLEGGPVRPIDALAVIDDTAGYHARVTEWWWSAGVGTGAGGESLAWNLVSGINDPREGSERAVWIAGAPREVPPVRFAADLSAIACTDGSELAFEAQAERRRSENLLLIRSDYRAPFGVFSGMLPGHVEIAHGAGVVEHHRARW
jgi:hypothetical protein